MDEAKPQNPALEAFLTADPATADAPPAPPPQSQPQATQPEPKPEQPKPKEADPTPPPEDEAEHDDGSGTVPIAALKKAREDHKSRAARAEGTIAELRAQLDAARNP